MYILVTVTSYYFIFLITKNMEKKATIRIDQKLFDQLKANWYDPRAWIEWHIKNFFTENHKNKIARIVDEIANDRGLMYKLIKQSWYVKDFLSDNFHDVFVHSDMTIDFIQRMIDDSLDNKK